MPDTFRKHCATCPASLLCLTGRLGRIAHCWCAVCEHYELQGDWNEETKVFTPRLVGPCPQDLACRSGAALSVCSQCQADQRRKRKEDINGIRRRLGVRTHDSM